MFSDDQESIKADSKNMVNLTLMIRYIKTFQNNHLNFKA